MRPELLLKTKSILQEFVDTSIIADPAPILNERKIIQSLLNFMCRAYRCGFIALIDK
jgi:hypothetical protein